MIKNMYNNTVNLEILKLSFRKAREVAHTFHAG